MITNTFLGEILYKNVFATIIKGFYDVMKYIRQREELIVLKVSDYFFTIPHGN